MKYALIILTKLGLSQPLFWHKLYSKLGFGIAVLVSSAGIACA